MLCTECNKSGGCWCDAENLPGGRVKFVPIDHEKELKKWLAEIKAETQPNTNYFYNKNDNQ